VIKGLLVFLNIQNIDVNKDILNKHSYIDVYTIKTRVYALCTCNTYVLELEHIRPIIERIRARIERIRAEIGHTRDKIERIRS